MMQYGWSELDLDEEKWSRRWIRMNMYNRNYGGLVLCKSKMEIDQCALSCIHEDENFKDMMNLLDECGWIQVQQAMTDAGNWRWHWSCVGTQTLSVNVSSWFMPLTFLICLFLILMAFETLFKILSAHCDKSLNHDLIHTVLLKPSNSILTVWRVIRGWSHEFPTLLRIRGWRIRTTSRSTTSSSKLASVK